MEAGDPSGDTQALVPYSLYNPFQDQLRCEDRMITIGPTDLHVKQAWQAGGRGGTDIGFGASVYDSSIVLSLFVNDSRQEVRTRDCVDGLLFTPSHVGKMVLLSTLLLILISPVYKCIYASVCEYTVRRESGPRARLRAGAGISGSRCCR